MNSIERLQQGLTNAFVDHHVEANLAYKPQFVSNNYKEGRKVLTTIEEELLRCQEFSISVAFITKGGLVSLLHTLKELESRGIRGRILTTDYQTFTDPEALDKLHELDNIELKMYYTEGTKEGFHTKGYIFKKQEIYRIIVGSANMTAAALTKNAEWNTKLVSTEQGEVAIDILQEFNNLWNSELSKDYEDVIDLYRIKHRQIKQQKKLARQNATISLRQYTLQPNRMQVEFINNVREIRAAGKDRALLISATGTGKTYASAFALRDHNPKKALFLVHREQIAAGVVLVGGGSLLNGFGHLVGRMTKLKVRLGSLPSSVQLHDKAAQGLEYLQINSVLALAASMIKIGDSCVQDPVVAVKENPVIPTDEKKESEDSGNDAEEKPIDLPSGYKSKKKDTASKGDGGDYEDGEDVTPVRKTSSLRDMYQHLKYKVTQIFEESEDAYYDTDDSDNGKSRK